jgi:hypothetical protein
LFLAAGLAFGAVKPSSSSSPKRVGFVAPVFLGFYCFFTGKSSASSSPNRLLFFFAADGFFWMMGAELSSSSNRPLFLFGGG